jgi:serine protease Do
MFRHALACVFVAFALVAWPDAAALGQESLLDAYFEQAMRRRGKAEAAEIGARLLEEHADDALTLDTLAWQILTDESLRHRDLALALRASARAHEITAGDDLEVLETYARGLVAVGRRDEGLALHRRAIKLAADEPSVRLVLEEILEDYLEPRTFERTDDDLINDLEAAADRLVDSGDAIPVATLLNGASIRPVDLDLPKPSERSLSGEELYEQVRPSVVVMAALEPDPETDEDELTLASGFVIHASGIVATNFHVVDAPQAPVLVAMTATGEVLPVTKILAVSPAADIAICQLETADNLPALPLATDARPGTRLHALSHPDGGFWSLTDGILSRFFTFREGGQTVRMFTTTADFAVGSSGGPLVDDRGNVVGMVSSTLAIYAQEGSPPRRQSFDTPDDHGDAFDEEPANVFFEDDAMSADGLMDPLFTGGDFQMGLNMCVPAADILRLTGHPAGHPPR